MCGPDLADDEELGPGRARCGKGGLGLAPTLGLRVGVGIGVCVCIHTMVSSSVTTAQRSARLHACHWCTTVRDSAHCPLGSSKLHCAPRPRRAPSSVDTSRAHLSLDNRGTHPQSPPLPLPPLPPPPPPLPPPRSLRSLRSPPLTVSASDSRALLIPRALLDADDSGLGAAAAGEEPKRDLLRKPVAEVSGDGDDGGFASPPPPLAHSGMMPSNNITARSVSVSAQNSAPPPPSPAARHTTHA